MYPDHRDTGAELIYEAPRNINDPLLQVRELEACQAINCGARRPPLGRSASGDALYGSVLGILSARHAADALAYLDRHSQLRL